MSKAVNLSTTRVGESIRANNGLMMTIIAYRNAKDLDVQFDDGTIIEHRTYKHFRTGQIACTVRSSWVGDTMRARNGMIMTIIADRGQHDIDVQFEDGAVVTHLEHSNFKRGSVRHPSIRYCQGKLCPSHLNAQSIAQYSCMRMTITEYQSSRNFVVTFESGYTTTFNSYVHFKRGNVRHPFPYNIDTVVMEAPAYMSNGVGNFFCHCTKCGIRDIMTIQEMRDHICEK